MRQIYARRGIYILAGQRQAGSAPTSRCCSLVSTLNVFNTGTRKGRGSSRNVGSVQCLDPENGKLAAPEEESGWIAVWGGRNLI